MAKATRITRYIATKRLLLSKRTILNNAAETYAVKPVIKILNKYPRSTFTKGFIVVFLVIIRTIANPGAKKESVIAAAN